MRPPLNPVKLMLLWQLTMFAVLSMPFVLFFTWMHAAELWVYPLIVSCLVLYALALYKAAAKVAAHGFRSDDVHEETDGHGILASLRLPDEFRRLARWSYLAAPICAAGTRDWPVGPSPITEIAITAVLYAAACGCFWLVWSRGGLRFPAPQLTEPPTAVTVGVHGVAPERARSDEPVGAVRRFPDGNLVRQVVWDVIDTGCLPAVKGGSRTWPVSVDGRDVAIVTQTWHGPRWWPEPDWLVEPDTPIDGGRVEFRPGT